MESTWSSRLRHHAVRDSGVTAWPQDISALRDGSSSSEAGENSNKTLNPTTNTFDFVWRTAITYMAKNPYNMDLDHPACSQTWALCLLGRIFSPLDPEKSCCLPRMSSVLSVDGLSLYWSPSLAASVFCSCFQFFFWLALLVSHMNTWNPLAPPNIFFLVYEHNLSKRGGKTYFLILSMHSFRFLTSYEKSSILPRYNAVIIIIVPK